jgi:hypothetical protein
MEVDVRVLAAGGVGMPRRTAEEVAELVDRQPAVVTDAAAGERGSGGARCCFEAFLGHPFDDSTNRQMAGGGPGRRQRSEALSRPTTLAGTP